VTPPAVKQCCANAYQSDFARILLGDSFHPGGLELTRRMATLLELRPGMRVLDVASGKGESAIFLAKEIGCEVVGLDLGAENVHEARRRAEAANVAALTTFQHGDAESMEFPTASFDCVICECAFCTFPDKDAASREFARVLRDSGRVGLSDLTRAGSLPPDLDGLLAWVACIADARPVQEYAACLESAGFTNAAVELHDRALAQMARDVQGRLLGLELMSGLGKIDLAGVDLDQAKRFARAAMRAIEEHKLGYALIVANQGARSVQET
jgi:ubiquinone/menaquinone biosynthesis C-methylase UbiE